VSFVDNVLEKEIEIISLKSNQSINESNLMVVPFISMNKTKIKILERSWMSNGTERSIKVVGSAEHGCPTIAELDVLLGLFRILMKNVGFQYEYNRSTGKVNLPKVINFTYQELASELGYKVYGGALKKKLENSVKCLNEATIYSNFGLRDAEIGDYIIDYNKMESFRILGEYKSYSYSRKKKQGEKIGNAKQVKEQQSIEISNFFFNSICNNYFKIYNYGNYIKLSKGLSKKLYLLLNQWSHGYEKYLTYPTLYDMLGLDVKTSQKEYYYNRLIKDALDELVEIKFIQNYEIKKTEGVILIFNENKRKQSKYLDKYNSQEEIITRLQSIGLSLEEWTKYYRLDNQDYVKALLRYVDYRENVKKDIKNILDFTRDGLKKENYEVGEFMD
jgi:hypothetical protein